MKPLALSSLDIAEYRGISGMNLDGFGRINLFVGGNNTGKTSVLEALALFARPLDIDNWVRTAWGRATIGSRIPLAETIKWMCPRRAGEPDDTGLISIAGQGSFAGRLLRAEYHQKKVVAGLAAESAKGTTIGEPIGRELVMRIESGPEYAGHPAVGNEQGGNPNAAYMRIAEDDGLTYSPRAKEPLLPLAFIDITAHREMAKVQDLYSAALSAEKPAQDFKGDFIRTLQQIDPGVRRLDLVQTGRLATRLQIKHEKTGVTPLSAMGDGFRRALMIAVTVPTVRGGVLLIDELETALHVGVLDSVLGLLKWAAEEFDVQVFATTHSLEAVDAVCRNFASDLDQVAGFRIGRSDSSGVVKRYPGKFLNDIRFERGLDIR